MRLFFILIFLLLLVSCTKPKSVLICGDHVCINNQEANQYFEDNLSIEVKIISKERTKNIDLVELNLQKDENDNRKISLEKKERTKKPLKELSSEEIIKIKQKIKNKKNEQRRIVKKIDKKKGKKKVKKLKFDKNKKKNNPIKNKFIKNDDICTVLEKCNIQEISKYLINQGKKKNFPDITVKE